jgi:acetylornithine deacetylase/succinyl-diaminopimelate desuccinylase-like protein
MCTAQGGHIDLVLEASAPSTHAYAARAHRSPIDVILDAVEALRSLPSLDARHPLLPQPRAHLGHVQGGEHLWRTPGGARAEMGIGLVPSDDPAHDPNAVCAEIRKRLDAIAEGWDTEGGSFVYEIRDVSVAIEIGADVPIVTRLASVLGPGTLPSGMSSWTDAGNLLTYHGIPCVIFGAGELDTAHSNHEWVELADLVRLSELLVAVFRTDGTAR